MARTAEQERAKKARQRARKYAQRLESGEVVRADAGTLREGECEGCANIARMGTRGQALHSCEDFPLPAWAGEYLDWFNVALSATDGLTVQSAMAECGRVLRNGCDLRALSSV